MGKQILVDKYLPSGCGFKVIRTDDDISKGNWNINVSNAVHFLQLKKWCQKNCQGIWAYTPQGEHRTNWADEIRDHRQSIHHYFAFVDEEDITMALLVMGLDSAHAKSMWPSKAKFLIYYRD